MSNGKALSHLGKAVVDGLDIAIALTGDADAATNELAAIMAERSPALAQVAQIKGRDGQLHLSFDVKAPPALRMSQDGHRVACVLYEESGAAAL